jgi:hypothetical protein
MLEMIRQLLDDYHPLYFLAALGTGGVAVSFYVYLIFIVPHPDTPVVTIDHLWPLLRAGDPLAGALAGLALLAMLAFALLHLRLVIWNLLAFRRYRASAAYQTLRAGHGEATLLAIPLTLAMSVNVAFMAALAVVPDLWRHIESVFPLALLAYLALGALALFLYGRFVHRTLRSRRAKADRDPGLGSLLAAFAFAMIAMGLAAPGCMSQQAHASATGVAGAVFFATLATVLGVLHLAHGLREMWRHGLSATASPGLWITLPILTLLGIVTIRLELDPMQGFDQPLVAPGLFTLTATILVVQLLFGLFGYRVMQRLGYFRDYLHGTERHPGSYTLICPGIALFVFGMYFLTYGLVKNGLLEAFSWGYFALLAPLALIQFKTLGTLFRLNRRLLGNPLAV